MAARAATFVSNSHRRVCASRHAAGMSAAIDTIECMFEYGGMTPAAATLASDAPAPDAVRELQARIRSMQATKLDTRLIPTHPVIAELLPGGGLKQGATYSVEHSATLIMALLAGPSAAGSWCGVVGVPEFGIEAASSFGIDLDRLVLVPNPGDQWLAVTAAIADVMGVVVTRPPRRTSDGNLARLAARLRQRGSTLLVLGSWPQSEAMLSLSESSWSGIGEGHGHLSARQVTVTVSTRAGSGRPRSARLWLPDSGMGFGRVADIGAGTSTLRDGRCATSSGQAGSATGTGSATEAVAASSYPRAV